MLEHSRSVKLLTENHLEFLSLKGGYKGLSQSIIVKIPHCWKPHVAAQIRIIIFSYTLLSGGLLPAGAESVVPTAVVVVVVVAVVVAAAAGHFVVVVVDAAVVVVAVVTEVSAGAAAGWTGQPAVAVVVAGADYLPFSTNYIIDHRFR